MDKLPIEMLERVFEFLPYKDRKIGALVNSRWRAAGEASHLWDWVRLPRVVDQWSCNRVIQMLNCSRLASVKEIVVKAEALSDHLLQAVILHKGLKQMEIWGDWLARGVDSQLLVEAITRVESLDLQIKTNSLPSHVFIALLTKVTAGCSLKEIYLHSSRHRDWTSYNRYPLCDKEMPATTLASAFPRLTKLHLSGTILTDSHLGTLMEGISRGNSSLNDLALVKTLDYDRTGTGTGQLDLKPLVNVEKVRLVCNCFTWKELVDFFATVSPSTKLKKLELKECKSFEPENKKKKNDGRKEMMAKAINFLEEAHLDVDSRDCEVHTFSNLFHRKF